MRFLITTAFYRPRPPAAKPRALPSPARGRRFTAGTLPLSCPTAPAWRARIPEAVEIPGAAYEADGRETGRLRLTAPEQVRARTACSPASIASMRLPTRTADGLP
ncbi:hypothetical protein ACFV0W_04850 [Streptomyces anulatus]